MKNFNSQITPQSPLYEEKKELEGDTLKKFAVAILLVILSLSLLSVALLPNVKADPSDIKILSYSWYSYPTYGDFIVVGEVQNVGTSVIDHVNIEGVANTTAGPQADSMTSAFGENLLPGQKAPFYMLFTAQNAIWGNMTWATQVTNVDLRVVYANDTTTQPFSGLAIVANTSYTGTDGVFTVTGVVQNTAAVQSPSMVWVVTTFYNASGTVVGLNETANPYLTSSMAPNATFSFTATPDDYTQINSQITSYSLLVQSRETTSATPTPTPSASPSESSTTSFPTVSPSPQPTQSSAPQQNSSDSLLIYAIIGAVIVIVIVGVAYLFLRRRG